jgi:hypothetical protein
VVANRRNPTSLLWCLGIFLCLEFYSLFAGPEYQIEGKRFLFDDTPISFQTWLDYFMTRVAWIIGFKFMRDHILYFWHELDTFAWLMVGYWVDYILIFNNPYARLTLWGYKIPLSYTSFMILMMAGVIAWSTWRYHKRR